MKTRNRTIGILGIALLMTVVAIAIAGLVVHIGAYNVAATEQHTAAVYRLLDHAMRRSVKLRASTIRPPDLNDAQRVQSGLQHYRDKCLQCHGAPGIAPQDFGRGMAPAPANLVATAREWQAAEIFWTVKHGIKMTGMPAWQYRMSDQDIWDVVAFVKMLPTLSPQIYAAWNEAMPVAPAKPADGVPLAAAAAAQEVALGDPELGRRALEQYLCATCHRIPGVASATKHVGPPLNGIATRQYIAGVLPNTPANMVLWIKHPRQINPLSAMPDLDVQEEDARDIAAYLYTLKEIK